MGLALDCTRQAFQGGEGCLHPLRGQSTHGLTGDMSSGQAPGRAPDAGHLGALASPVPPTSQRAGGGKMSAGDMIRVIFTLAFWEGGSGSATQP